MKPSKTSPDTLWVPEDEFQEEMDFDVYSDNWDDDEGLDRGMKPNEVAFLKGFRKSS